MQTKAVFIALPCLLLTACSALPERRAIHTDAAPAAVGPYSQAIQVGHTLYLAGQIGIDPATGAMAADTRSQAEQVLANLGAVLEAAGFSFADVVQAQVYLADIGDYGVVNEVYARAFDGTAPPARAAVQVANLPKGARVEILMTAVRSR